MREKGFDQLPVLSALPGRKLVGLITLGNCLSWISQGRARSETEVKEVMFDFSKLSEVVTTFGDVGDMSADVETENGDELGAASKEAKKGKRFVEITLDTPLKALCRFFEWNSAAVVTETYSEGTAAGGMKPIAVVTKVDLLTWLVKQEKAAL